MTYEQRVARARVREIQKACDIKLAELKGSPHRASCLLSYFACFKAIIINNKRKHMQPFALRAYMRYMRLLMAVETGRARDDVPELRLARLKRAMDAAWDKYQAMDRNALAA